MGITLTKDEKLQLQKNAARGGWSVSKLESAEEQPWSFYYDPKRGREMWLPSDAWNLRQYKDKGYKLGRLPTEFTPIEDTPDGGSLPADIQLIVNAAVKAALKTAGVVPSVSNQDIEQLKEPVQLKML